MAMFAAGFLSGTLLAVHREACSCRTGSRLVSKLVPVWIMQPK